MSMVGFDIGNENCVVATVKQTGVDVLLNDESKCKTPAVVCFGEKQRFLGSVGAASAMMHPKSTISQVKRLIGRSFKEPDVQDELRMFPFETSQAQDGSILIHLKYLSETQIFTPVQIMAMLFAHLKDITEKNLETRVSDCVIGIPSYFTDLQRRAYLNAAAIAGLKPLRLMHDCTATALSYGFYKTDFSNASPHFVAFIDIGHCDTQVCIASFQTRRMKILSHAFDRSLGGRDFDEVLFNHFAAQFKEQYNIDVYPNERACTRLRAACEKLKKVLSANPVAPLNIECLMDEKDVKGFIKREEFEKLASGLLDRFSVPCNKALADARLTVENIHSVELVGYGSWIPAITRLVASIFKGEPSRTVNAGECVARGCAIQCAILSPSCRVVYKVEDSFPFSIGLSLVDDPVRAKSNDILLFPKGQSIPEVKILNLQRSSMFQLEAFYVDLIPGGVPSTFSSFTSGHFNIPHGKKAKVKVNVRLNIHGIVIVESATLIEDHINNTITRGNAHANLDKMKTSGSSGTTDYGVEDGATKELKLLHASADGMRKHRTTGRVDIPVSENIYGGMTKAELLKAQEKEQQLAQQDRTMEQIKVMKNVLESYVYEMRNKLVSTYWSFANDEEREFIPRRLEQTEKGLYEDRDDETDDAYSSELEYLKKLVDPIESRYKEEGARAQAREDLLKCISGCRNSVDSHSLPPNDREMIINNCNLAEQWLSAMTQQQDFLPKTSNPVLWSTQIKRTTECLERNWKDILKSKASPSGNWPRIFW